MSDSWKKFNNNRKRINEYKIRKNNYKIIKRLGNIQPYTMFLDLAEINLKISHKKSGQMDCKKYQNTKYEEI